jgi:hypothetical protein
MATSPSRRRERSVRATSASLLLVVATASVVAATVVGTLVWLSLSAAFAALVGWVVARLYRSELVVSRRESAAVRAGLAAEYRDLLDQKSDEQAVFLSAMTDQLVFRERELAELEGVVTLAERRADVAEEQLRASQDELKELQLLHDLQGPIPQGSAGDDAETVVDLLGWGRTSSAVQRDQRLQA